MGTDEKRIRRVLWSGVLASLVHRGGDTHPDGALGHFCVEVTLKTNDFSAPGKLGQQVSTRDTWTPTFSPEPVQASGSLGGGQGSQIIYYLLLEVLHHPGSFSWTVRAGLALALTLKCSLAQPLFPLPASRRIWGPADCRWCL